MMRNDYRRSLILLRSNAPGFSGHVRLERRTLMGSMYFVVQIPGSGVTLRAALVGRNRDGYYACSLGELRQDGRGQATLGYNFDPRCICDRELEQYQLIVVVRVDGSCEILLTGNLNGYAEVNWERVRAAVCALYAQEGPPPRPFPVVPPPRPQEGPPPRPYPTEPALPEDTDPPGPPPRPYPTEPAVPENRPSEPDQRPDRPPENSGNRPQPPADGGIPPRSFPTPELQPSQSEIPAEAILQQEAVAAGSFAQPQEEAPAPAQTAAELLAVDMNLPWPEEAERLKPMFMQQEAMQDVPRDGFVYVQAPLPDGCGYPYCAAGIRVENGAPAVIRYALPSAWGMQPPAGLEEAMWLGNNNAGWWVTQVQMNG